MDDELKGTAATLQVMDKRALRILSDTYWTPKGWRSAPTPPSEEDDAYAKAHGVMFDPVALSHDQVLARLRTAVDRLSLREVADGFLSSLSSRQLDWRSALGSYSVAQHLPQHRHSEERQCSICGLYASSDNEPRDLNVLNFERLKWGGVRHLDPLYAALDLELFLEEPPPAPTDDDIALFRQLVSAIEDALPHMTSASLHKQFPAGLRANKAERDSIVGILGYCGVLGTPDHPGFGETFVHHADRVLPDRHFVDLPYPACWWRRSDAVNPERLRDVFGHVL